MPVGTPAGLLLQDININLFFGHFVKDFGSVSVNELPVQY